MITPSSNAVSQETVSEAVGMTLDQRNLVAEQVGREQRRAHEFQAMNCNAKSHPGQKKFIWECLSKKSFQNRFWRRKWQLIPVFLPGEFHGLCSPWGHKESDTTE